MWVEWESAEHDFLSDVKIWWDIHLTPLFAESAVVIESVSLFLFEKLSGEPPISSSSFDSSSFFHMRANCPEIPAAQRWIANMSRPIMGFDTIKVAVVCIWQDWSEFGDCSVAVQSKCCWAHANQVSHGDGHFCLNKKKMDSHQKPLTLLWIYTYERRETVGYLVVGWNLIGSKYSTIALCQDLVLFCLIFYQLRVHDICLQYLDYRCQKLGISHHELLILI